MNLGFRCRFMGRESEKYAGQRALGLKRTSRLKSITQLALHHRLLAGVFLSRAGVVVVVVVVVVRCGVFRARLACFLQVDMLQKL